MTLYKQQRQKHDKNTKHMFDQFDQQVRNSRGGFLFNPDPAVAL